ncbi:nucleotide sugar dehydrogenase [Streptomyces sp. BE230]|uniref:nucleotide sugar dehydrogenase n=1 Tax=Streptomyces sp. BE230 TaxID=3002526 RepID=UPI002ED5D01C|nr:nucleotide sugar dehydrogenase [Streptomyces sp. BE230]
MSGATTAMRALTQNAERSLGRSDSEPEQVRPLSVLVVGQGYVGLPLAVRAALVGHKVVGFDSDVRRVGSLIDGVSPIGDVSSAQLAALLRAGTYLPTTVPADGSGFDVAVIAVPTPLRQGAPDLSDLIAAGRTVGRHLRKGALVVLESTSYPGTTRDVLGPVLAEASGLTMGSEFALGFSPERIDPGNRVWTLQTTPKIVSGIDAASLERTAAFYRYMVDHVVPVGRCEEAELAKLIENVFRAVNIALVNELAEMARDTGLNLREALGAADTKPFGFLRFDPGPGIGGHCLPIDPVYLSWWAARARGRGSRLIDLAAQINADRPAYVVNRLAQHLAQGGRDLDNARVLLLGLAYKPGCGDLRESPALEVARMLTERGVQVSAADQFVDEGSAALDGLRMVRADEDEIAAADAVVLLTDHDGFDYERVLAGAAFVLDCRGRLVNSAVPVVEQL